MIIRKFKNIQIWKYTNIHVGKNKCKNCKRVCKESKCVHKKINRSNIQQKR